MMASLFQYRLDQQSRFAGYVTKLLILGIDMLFSFMAISLALFIEVRFDMVEWREYMFNWAPWVLLAFRAIGFVIFRTYLIIIRYVGEKDIRNLFYAVTSSSAAFTVFMYFNQQLLPPGHLSTILILDYFIVLFLGGGFRAFLRIFYAQMRSRHVGSRLNTVIYGAGEMGATVEQVLRGSISHKYKVVAFFDDNPRVHKKSLNGIPIYNPARVFDPVIKNNDVEIGIIAIKNLPDERRVRFINRCLELKVKVMKVPPTTDWLNNRLNVGQLRKIDFEDLLNRPAIQLDKKRIADSIKGKVVMVTGCAGSIGSEIVNQLLRYQPSLIVGIDQAETPLAKLCRELKAKNLNDFKGIVGDVRDYNRMNQIFNAYKPQMVFHAAAYKHVPIMEDFPEEAIKANVKGTLILAELAHAYKVEKFVMVSTDKVVNPTNIMGASKRIAEIYVQSMDRKKNNGTAFITTRFGNVLGSNGSVIPIFKRQIEDGEPVTVTHPEVTRYFMTIPEACQLVLEAGAMGEGGEIFVFDMGKPVKIDNLARKMIKMYGLEVGEDIEIQYSGLRPGEKLFEELLDEKENLQATHHPKIMRAAVREVERTTANVTIKALIKKAEDGDAPDKLIMLIKELVPEYQTETIIHELPSSKGTDDSLQEEIKKEEFKQEKNKQNPIKKIFLRTFGKVIPSDIFSNRFPVSVKGICFINDQLILLKNEQGNWDLPGGKLKVGEDFECCLIREFKEEVNIDIEPVSLQKVHHLKIRKKVNVVIALYTCRTTAGMDDLQYGPENFGVGLFSREELPGLGLPKEYVEVIGKL